MTTFDLDSVEVLMSQNEQTAYSSNVSNEKSVEGVGAKCDGNELHDAKQISIRLDADVMQWLRSQGDDYQTQINLILRESMANAARSKIHSPNKNKNIEVYKIAYEYLKKMKPEGVHLDPYFSSKSSNTLQDIYVCFIHSAQSRYSMPNIIKFSDREKDLKSILFGYDINKINNLSCDVLFDRFNERFGDGEAWGKDGLWYSWSRSVIDVAKFLSEFKNADEFNSYVAKNSNTNDSRKKLAGQIAKKVYGMGFVLVCNALKELGYTRFSKPDVHLKDVFSKIDLCGNDDYSVFDAIERMAEDCKEFDPTVTPYKVDKIFWLICSGKFYKEKIKVKGRKNDLINELKSL